jgi:HEAT repeat protein
LRTALALAADQPRASSAFAAELEPGRFASRPLTSRIDLLRALGANLRAIEAGREAFAATARDRSFRTRYLLLQPAAQLAHAGDDKARAFVARALRDPNHHVRAQAARVSAGIATLARDLARLLSDRQPRVRQAALEGLSHEGLRLDAHAERRMVSLLAGDPWTFVRVGAAGALGARPPTAERTEALLDALDDVEKPVRRAALEALGRSKSHAAAERIVDIAADPQQAVSVRTAAIEALALLCHRDAADLLFKLALRTGHPELAFDHSVGMAALHALGDIKPPGLRARLQPILGSPRVPPLVRTIARDAVERPGRCSGSRRVNGYEERGAPRGGARR